jgi:hypothetical protein
MSGTKRLAHLLALADQGPAMRAALAEEVAELLLAWPKDCPTEMRGACEALLARAAGEVDDDTRARLRVRLHRDVALVARVLPREGLNSKLLEAAHNSEEVASRLARALDLSEDRVLEILCDETGHALAVAAKALGLSRAVFSSLVLLSCPLGDADANTRRLEAYDKVSVVEATRKLRRWTGKAHIAA